MKFIFRTSHLNLFRLKNHILFTFLLSVFLSNSTYPQIVIELGTKLYNIDDIRLGDFKITSTGPTMVATDEVTLIVLELLKLKSINVPNNGLTPNEYLNLLSNHLFAEFGYTDTRSAGLIWSKFEQVWLDSLVVHYYDQLFAQTIDFDLKALIAFVKAQHLFNYNNFDAGIDEFKNIAELYANTDYASRAELEIAFRLFKVQKYSETIAQCKKVLLKFPDTRASQDANYFIARSYHLINNHTDAVKFFDDLITKYPQNKWNEGAKYFRAKSNYYLSKVALANSQFEDFINSYPQSEYRDDAREMMAAGFQKENNFEKAIEMYEKYKIENPSVLDQMAAETRIFHCADALRSLASTDSIKKIYYDSVATFYPNKLHKFINENSMDNTIKAQGWFALAQYYENYNDLDSALYYLQKLDSPLYTTNKPRTQNYNRNCADCDYGLIQQSLIEFTKTKIFLKKGNVLEAKKYRDKLYEKKYSYYYYSLLLAEIDHYAKRKEYRKAEKQYFDLYRDQSAPIEFRARALFNIAYIYAALGDDAPSTPKSIFQRVIDEFPNEKVTEAARYFVTKNQ